MAGDLVVSKTHGMHYVFLGERFWFCPRTGVCAGSAIRDLREFFSHFKIVPSEEKIEE
jgi:hypothetical protein